MDKHKEKKLIMILTIDAKYETFDTGLTKKDHISIEVDTSNIDDISYLFSRKFIIDTINNQYLQGKLVTEWINNDDWIREYRADSIIFNRSYASIMKMNLSRYTSILGDNVLDDFNTIDVLIRCDNERETELYIQYLFKLEYRDTTVYNAVILLPDFLDDFTSDITSLTNNYISIHGCSMWDGWSRWRSGEKMYDEFFYIIQKKDLRRPVLKIHAPDVLLKHLIGKNGDNINKLKELLHSEGWNKIVKIHLIGVDSNTCEKYSEYQ